MEKNDFNEIGLSLKEYRDKYGANFPLCVVKTAYGYSKKGVLPQQALANAAAVYAELFKQRELSQCGLMAEKRQNTVTIWNLQTETSDAQQRLLQGEWDFHNHAMCIARLGENYACTRRTTLEFSSNQVVGICEHKHRFIAVVALEQSSIPTDVVSVQESEKLANLVAENAVSLYKGYLMSVERRRQLSGNATQQNEKLNHISFENYLLQHKILFVEGLNPENDFLGKAPKVSVEQFLVQQGDRLKQTFRIADIKIFGDFEHF
ncbi:MAG: hypothetical protein IJ545_01250 [Alphaproteobacteria bacterium]|nr:hypothetical protein [Alphaproteobacteria bacterium]